MDLSFNSKTSYTKFILLTAMISVFALVLSTQSEAKVWSERKFEKTILRIDKDLTRKRWQAVINRGQKALPQCIALYSERALTCIFVLRNINQSYEKMYIFNPDSSQIEKAYRLSAEILGQTHPTTDSTRDYYYKYLIFSELYAQAIPLLKEFIAIEKNSANDAFQLMERYKQLYALEGLVENWPEEEKALTMVLRLARDVMGEDSEDFKAAVEALAYNYCTQKKYYEYFQLIKEQQQEVSCFSEPKS
jgi:tetratricopeptide (TPR) repeat protein